MEFTVVKNIDKSKFEIYLISLITLLFLFRTENPILKYPFIFLYLGFIIYVLIFYKGKIISNLKEYFINYLLIIILLVILLLAFFFSHKIYLIVFKDAISAFILLSFFLVITILISSRKEFLIFFNSLIEISILFALFFSILNLLDLFDIWPYSGYFLTDNGIAIDIDDNFALLPVIFGLLGVFYSLAVKEKPVLQKIFYNILLIIFSLQIFLSGSKRGFIVFVLIIFALILIRIFLYFKSETCFGKINSFFSFYLISLILIAIFAFLFINNVSFISKNNFLKNIGTKNISDTRERISSNLLTYFSHFDHKLGLEEFNNKIWSIHNDPREPDLGWCGLGIHKTIFPLIGTNRDIVPAGSKGFMIDSTFNVQTWDGDSYSITLLGKSLVDNNEKATTSVYCYVSEDFNGTSVALVLLYTKAKEVNSLYDLKFKGTWQKLTITDECLKGKAHSFFYVTKFGVTNFSSLKGYVIIAYPQFEIISDKKGVRSFYSSLITGKERGLLIDDYAHQPSDLSQFNIFCTYKNEASFFNFKFLSFLTNQPGLIKKDPIRNFFKKFISEDTSYYSYKSNIVLDSTKNIFEDDRIVRWQFGLQIYAKEYNWSKKLLGGGFDHLNWYAFHFLKDKTKSDWPHNPFLSILLYSGIFGLILYLYFLYKVFFYYLKYTKEYPLLFIFFIITFFFSFFSGGSPFDPPIMGFFSILPFFIHSIHKKTILN